MRDFGWDADKNQLNIEKHGVDFELAKEIFKGPVLSHADDRAEYGEIRMIGIGALGNGAILTVVYTERLGSTRLISARPASRRERENYNEKTC